MPKMKSKRGAAKRFRVRGSGSIKRGGAYKRHILTKKTTKRKRQMRRRSGVDQFGIRHGSASLRFAWYQWFHSLLASGSLPESDVSIYLLDATNGLSVT